MYYTKNITQFPNSSNLRNIIVMKIKPVIPVIILVPDHFLQRYTLLLLARLIPLDHGHEVFE